MKLTDFKDEEAIQVIADILPYIGRIAANKGVSKSQGGSKLDFVSNLLHNSPTDTMAILAILNREKPEEYHCNAAEVFINVCQMISDPELLALFGLRSETKPPSGSASTTGEAETPEDS